MEDREKLLDEAIVNQFKGLSQTDIGSKEESTAADTLDKLYHLRIDIDKNRQDAEEKRRQRSREDETAKREEEARQQQIANENRHRYIGYGLAVFSVLAPITAYAIFYDKGLDFERGDSFTSTSFRETRSKWNPLNLIKH